MIEIDSGTATAVHTYYEALGGGSPAFAAERLRAILADDVIFDGPVSGRAVGAQALIRVVAGLVVVIRGLTMLYQLVDGDTAAALYDVELPGGPLRCAEFFGVGNGQIRTLRLLHDVAEYHDRGGP